ncbi:MAG TPA: hypothetical protein VIK89_10510 [Cytophagaceae bacterium]
MYNRKKRYYHIIAWLLLAVYLLNPFKIFQPILNYQANYHYISTVLCENKDKPELACNGVCYLKKEISKAAQEQTQQVKSETKVEIDYLTYIELSLVPQSDSKHTPVFADYTPDLLNSTLSILSPPPKKG